MFEYVIFFQLSSIADCVKKKGFNILSRRLFAKQLSLMIETTFFFVFDQEQKGKFLKR